MPTTTGPMRGKESRIKLLSHTPTGIRTGTDVKEQLGLEVPRQLQWHKWQAGGEFIKQLCIKNVSLQVVRVSYKLLHSSSPFSVDFPDTYKLSPGMVATIKVYFRPPKRQTYTEQLQLLLCDSGGIIHVPLEAVLPASKLQLPASIDFGCVPAKEQVVQQLPIKNVGDAALRYNWKIEAPFAIVPVAGQLLPGQTVSCEVFFDPQEAAAYRACAACTLDNGELLTVQINGMAKFPFLSIEADCTDFGSVGVGQTAEQYVRFGNHSAVPANFSLTAANGSNDGVFTIQPSQGTLQPNSYSVLHVVYSPKATGTFSCQTYSLSTPGGNKLSFVAQGTAVGPQLRLSSRVLNFGNVKSGQTPSKVLYLENCSNVPLVYEFLLEANGVFSLTKTRGVVPPRSLTHTALGFKETAPANYWQRIVCLVKDSDPVAIDALATCYLDDSRPPPLTYKHITAYLERVAAGEPPVPTPGLSTTQRATSAAGSPEPCSSVDNSNVKGTQQQPLMSNSSEGGGDTGSLRLQTTPQTQQQQTQQQLVGPDSWQLLFDGVDAAAAVTVSDSQLDFGSCSRLSPCEARSFSVNNNTGAKLQVSLIVPGWQDPLGPPGKLVQVFQAFPETLELRPHSSATIRLAFRPPRDGQYYCQGLLLLASLKAQRSFRLVQDGQVVPPWCVGLLASGNTFANQNPEFSPKVSLSTSSVSFPPCCLGDAVHQTLALLNDGDTPVHFRFTSPAVGSNDAGQGGGNGRVVGGCSWFGPFGVLPCQGVLEPKSQHLVAFRFRPTDLSLAQLKLTCVFNHTPVNSTSLLLSGTASEPLLSWDVADNRLFFRPTCVGAASQRVINVTNVSRVPVGWQWVLSKKIQEAVQVEPLRGILRGFESTKVTVRFAPIRQQAYNARAALLLLPPNAVAAAAAGAGPAAVSADKLSLLSITAAGLVEAEQAKIEDEKADQEAQQPQLATLDAEKLILTIVGEATQGVLSVDPACVSFGVVNVGYPQRKTLSLINQSSGVLRYNIELVDEAPEGVDRNASACEFGSGSAATMAAGDSSGSYLGLDDCWVDEADGVVNARACKTITLTLLPRRRGQYKLSLHLRANSVPHLPKPPSGIRSASAGGSSTISATTAAAPGGTAPGLVAIAPLCSSTTAGLPTSSRVQSSWGGNAAAAGSVLEGEADICSRRTSSIATEASEMTHYRPPLATVAVTATASFPALLLTDVFCQGLAKQIAWQMLGLQQLNAELRSAVTSAELQAQALSDRGSLTNDNAAALLPPLEVDLGVAAAGQGPRTFWVQLENEGHLPLSWELHSYDTPEVELENWVEAARPLTKAEKERAFIIDNSIFEVHPRSGSLEPGSRELVCFTFNPVTEGTYQLPLFLRIKDGKQLQLQLSGRAVALAAQLPLFVRGSQSCVLAATPLGELEPPLQCYTLRNGGPAPLQYRLDVAPLQQLARQNYGAEVIKYAGGSPLAGEIPPGDVAVFNWLFQPLEPKAYSVVLPLALGPAPQQPLLLRGRGYHPVQHPEEAAFTEEELSLRWQEWIGFNASPGLAPPSRLLHVSQELLDLGVVLPASTSKRLLVLRNSATVPLTFVWDLGVFEEERRIISGRLNILPATGVLEPGESRVCQVSFQSGLQPQIVSGEIFCYARRESAEGQADSEGLEISDGLPPPAWDGMDQQQGQEQHDSEDPEDEIIAQHPQPALHRRSALARKIRNRLPLHLSMTEATRSKFKLLDQQYTRALAQQKLTLQQHSGRPGAAVLSATAGTAALGSSMLEGSAGGHGTGNCGSWLAGEGLLGAGQAVAVPPQLLTVTVQGSVLSKGHIQTGSYMPAAEQQDALKLLAVSHLLPAVEQPVSLLLPPGSMGASAAAAAAQKAAAAAASGSDWEAGGSCSSGTTMPLIAAAVGDPSLAAAGAVLQDMLGEVWADGEVAALFEHLDPAPVPVFAELKEKESCMPHDQNVDVQGKLASCAADSVDALPATAGGEGESCDSAEHSTAAAGGLGAGLATGKKTEATDATVIEAPLDVMEVLQQQEFQAFADFVLDSAIIGVLQEGVQEGVHGQEVHQQ